MSLLNNIEDFYKYGPYRARRLEQYVKAYYNKSIPYWKLLDEVLIVCAEITEGDRFYQYAQSLSKDIRKYLGDNHV